MKFLIRWTLFLLPPETAHHLALNIMRWMHPLLSKKWHPGQEKIGLAAGFDKNAEILEYLPRFGFGSVEIGTVTPKPQGGNPQPRLFRLTSDQSLFNRMGFNNLGAGIISERVRQARKKLPSEFKVGINLGKNKLTPDEDAAKDYAKAAEAFLDCADYFVINVSSPNTPGLRALQTPEALIPIVQAVKKEITRSGRKIPLRVKLAPELDPESLKALVGALESEKIDGLILTNTLSGTHIYRGKEYSGGYSGTPLRSLSVQKLKEVKSMTSIPITSVGGIMTAEDAIERFRSGASDIQIYTGWIYGGPFFARKLTYSISALK
jgi:dihydroorotate dehydrogenase